MEIKKVGIVGCGLMGSGIAQVCIQAGYQVVVSEINDELLNKGIDSIKANLDRNVRKGRMTEEDQKAALGRLKGTLEIRDFADCDLIIEAVIEQMEEKKKLLSALDQICPESTIFASNTSSLSIIEMASATNRPDRVLGLHFFNPVPVMRLIELVHSLATSDETINTAAEFGRSLGKEVVIVKDSPGFLVNLLLTPLMHEAMRALESGLATKEDIDTAVRLGLNHPMGPFTLADLIGLDTVYRISSAIYEEIKDPRFAPPPLLKQMVIAGWLGRKTGKGFYEYK